MLIHLRCDITLLVLAIVQRVPKGKGALTTKLRAIVSRDTPKKAYKCRNKKVSKSLCGFVFLVVPVLGYSFAHSLTLFFDRIFVSLACLIQSTERKRRPLLKPVNVR